MKGCFKPPTTVSSNIFSELNESVQYSKLEEGES